MLGMAYVIAFKTELQPTRELRGDDRARILAASSFVETHRKNTGQPPTSDEFSLWTKTAPSALRLEEVGIIYKRNDDRTYIFDWYGGRGITLWWKSNSGLGLANISMDSYFQFGSKLADLLIYFGLAVVSIWGAKLAKPSRRHRS